jgi:hypothetical protein
MSTQNMPLFCTERKSEANIKMEVSKVSYDGVTTTEVAQDKKNTTSSEVKYHYNSSILIKLLVTIINRCLLLPTLQIQNITSIIK